MLDIIYARTTLKRSGDANNYIIFYYDDLANFNKYPLTYFKFSYDGTNSWWETNDEMVGKYGNIVETLDVSLNVNIYSKYDIRNMLNFKHFCNNNFAFTSFYVVIKSIDAYIRTNCRKAYYTNCLTFSSNTWNADPSNTETYNLIGYNNMPKIGNIDSLSVITSLELKQLISSSTSGNYFYYDYILCQLDECHVSCKSCLNNNAPTSCYSCANGYFNNTSSTDGFSSTIICSPCYYSCGTCNSLGDDTNHQCKTCKLGFSNLIDNNLMCYNSTQSITQYYYDIKLNLFKKCYFSCEHCLEYGNIEDHKCISCLPSTYLFNNNCVSSCPSNYAQVDKTRQCNLCDSTCGTCSNSSSNGCKTCNTDFPVYNNGRCELNCKINELLIYELNLTQKCVSITKCIKRLIINVSKIQKGIMKFVKAEVILQINNEDDCNILKEQYFKLNTSVYSWYNEYNGISTSDKSSLEIDLSTVSPLAVLTFQADYIINNKSIINSDKITYINDVFKIEPLESIVKFPFFQIQVVFSGENVDKSIKLTDFNYFWTYNNQIEDILYDYKRTVSIFKLNTNNLISNKMNYFKVSIINSLTGDSVEKEYNILGPTKPLAGLCSIQKYSNSSLSIFKTYNWTDLYIPLIYNFYYNDQNNRNVTITSNITTNTFTSYYNINSNSFFVDVTNSINYKSTVKCEIKTEDFISSEIDNGIISSNNYNQSQITIESIFQYLNTKSEIESNLEKEKIIKLLNFILQYELNSDFVIKESEIRIIISAINLIYERDQFNNKLSDLLPMLNYIVKSSNIYIKNHINDKSDSILNEILDLIGLILSFENIKTEEFKLIYSLIHKLIDYSFLGIINKNNNEYYYYYENDIFSLQIVILNFKQQFSRDFIFYKRYRDQDIHKKINLRQILEPLLNISGNTLNAIRKNQKLTVDNIDSSTNSISDNLGIYSLYNYNNSKTFPVNYYNYSSFSVDSLDFGFYNLKNETRVNLNDINDVSYLVYLEPSNFLDIGNESNINDMSSSLCVQYDDQSNLLSNSCLSWYDYDSNAILCNCTKIGLTVNILDDFLSTLSKFNQFPIITISISKIIFILS